MTETKIIKGISACFIFAVFIYIFMIAGSLVFMASVNSMSAEDLAMVLPIGTNINIEMIKSTIYMSIGILVAAIIAELMLIINGFRVWKVKTLKLNLTVSIIFTAVHILSAYSLTRAGYNIVGCCVLPVLHFVYVLCWLRFMKKIPKNK